MSIYDPLAEFFGIKPNLELYNRVITGNLIIPDRFNSVLCSEEARKRNSEIVTCDKCGVKGNHPNMMRWHFQNCKTKLKNCTYCDKIIKRQGCKDFLYNVKKYCDKNCYNESKKGKVFLIMTDEIKNKLRKSALSRSKKLSSNIKKNEIWLKSGRWKKK